MVSVFHRRWFREEKERNERFDAPSDQQLRWHIEHMREDLSSLTRSSVWAVWVLLALLLLG